MGGNVMDMAHGPWGWWVAHCWVLKGQPQWGPDRCGPGSGVWWVLFGSGFEPGLYTAGRVAGSGVTRGVRGSVGCL
jgi:hypothetical protein